MNWEFKIEKTENGYRLVENIAGIFVPDFLKIQQFECSDKLQQSFKGRENAILVADKDFVVQCSKYGFGTLVCSNCEGWTSARCQHPTVAALPEEVNEFNIEQEKRRKKIIAQALAREQEQLSDFWADVFEELKKIEPSLQKGVSADYVLELMKKYTRFPKSAEMIKAGEDFN